MIPTLAVPLLCGPVYYSDRSTQLLDRRWASGVFPRPPRPSRFSRQITRNKAHFVRY